VGIKDFQRTCLSIKVGSFCRIIVPVKCSREVLPCLRLPRSIVAEPSEAVLGRAIVSIQGILKTSSKAYKPAWYPPAWITLTRYGRFQPIWILVYHGISQTIPIQVRVATGCVYRISLQPSCGAGVVLAGAHWYKPRERHIRRRSVSGEGLTGEQSTV